MQDVVTQLAVLVTLIAVLSLLRTNSSEAMAPRAQALSVEASCGPEVEMEAVNLWDAFCETDGNKDDGTRAADAAESLTRESQEWIFREAMKRWRKHKDEESAGAWELANRLCRPLGFPSPLEEEYEPGEDGEIGGGEG